MCVVFRIDSSTATTAEVTQPCALGYSGWFGVVRSGDHVASMSVAGLPSVSAARIAVTGRHRR